MKLLGVVGVLVGFGMTGCGAPGDEPGSLPEPFTHAIAMPDCAPWDGAAVSVILTTAPVDSVGMVDPPTLRISIWRSLDEVKQGTFSWPADAKAGVANWCGTADHCDIASSGQVRFGGMTPDSALHGAFELTFPGRSPVAGRFEAGWRRQYFLCG